ncbi:ead/Ea22-like family protein [Klebsiella pneumoniae]
MTDITELAQRMKTAAEKLDADQWQTRKGFSGIEVIVKGSLEKGHGCVSFQPVAADMADTKTARAIALFSPANVLALVEALEKAQQQTTESENRVRKQNRHICELFDDNTALRQRIAELESHAVTVENLQESAYRAGLTAGWNLGLANNNDGFNKCLAAHTAGIKVEAE